LVRRRSRNTATSSHDEHDWHAPDPGRIRSFGYLQSTNHWGTLEKLASFCGLTTTNCLSRLTLPLEHEPLGLGALQRGAHIDPACAVLAALVGWLLPIGKALVTASWPRSLWAK